MRLGGLILFLLLAPGGFIALALLLPMILWNPERAKEAMRAVDQLNNAFWLNGEGRESVSSHAWRDKQEMWAQVVIALTDNIQKGHCQEANRLEQPVVDFINN